MDKGNEIVVWIKNVKGVLAIAALICFPWQAICAGVEGIPYKNWLKYKETVQKDPSLVIYYTLEEGEGNQIENRAGAGNASMYDADNRGGLWVEGRWPEKRALFFDDGAIQAKGYNIENNRFTCELWIKKKGAGKIGAGMSGTLIGVEGFYAGWRIITSYASSNGKIESQVGQKAGAYSVSSASVSDNVWHHVAVTWDGEKIIIYIDGKPAVEKKSMGDYVAVDPALGVLCVGYGHFGVGSVKVEVDEVAIYNRALSKEEIKQHRYLIQEGIPCVLD